MNLKLLPVLVLILGGGLIGCSTIRHGAYLSASEDQIRSSILKITPLGTPFDEVKARILTKMHPDGFYYDKHAQGHPDTGFASGGKLFWNQWPLGGEHYGKQITCQIGIGGWLAEDFVNADWVFDDEDRLADVFVYKTANLP